jgi:hypothetical protein
LFFVFSPTISFDFQKGKYAKGDLPISGYGNGNLVLKNRFLTLKLLDSSLSNFVFYCSRGVRRNEVTVYFPRLFSEIKDVIKNNSRDSDIIYANFSYTAGILSLLSHRATSTAMLREVKPFHPFDEIAVSKLIVWQKNPDDMKEEPLHLIEKYHLNKIADTKLAFIYENPECRFKRERHSAVISYKMLFMIIFLTFMFLIGAHLPAGRQGMRKDYSEEVHF